MEDFVVQFRNAEGERHGPGTVLFKAGEKGSTMYVVREGEVAIQVGGVTVETVGPGGIVGEMALIDEEPRSATAVTVTPCDVVPVEQKRFLFLVQKTPYFAIEVLRVMARRLRSMNQRA